LAKKGNGCNPRAHRYVQAASDILMIAVGTRTVLDVIEVIAR
jgi:hypothetical protein